MDNRNINVTQNVGEVKEGGTVIGVQVVYQGEPVRIPSPEDIQLHRVDLTKIETYNRWADEFYIHEEGKVLPLFASPYEDDGGRKREDLLQTIRSHQRLLVLGEPGMGKTVALERMVWEIAKAGESIVPVFVQLLYFQGLDLIELIRVALNETGRLTFDNVKSVRAFLRETKCLILFDGLNETPGSQREQVIGAIANFMREYSEHRYVVTSRSQDELWRKLRSAELIQDAVVVQTISEAQSLGYLQAHLGREKGQALYDRLDTSLRSLARTPLLLKLIKDAGGGSDHLPRNRGELFDKYVMNKLLEREQKLELTETPETKKKALAHLAFALQLNHQLACDREWAEKVLAEKGLGAKTDTILKEALLHGLLIQQNLPDKQLLRFVHQSVQEYFVALTLLSEVKVEKNANLIQAASRRLSKRNLTDWAKDNWWAESFVQLAGLLDDADWLAQKITGTNPWLAWWCVQEGRDVPENTWEMIEARSIKLLHSQNIAERRRAVQTLAQIKNDRILEPLLIAAGDDDKEVSGLGLQALMENGEAVRPIIRKVLQGNDRKNWLASLRYLRTMPSDLLWADIPDQMIDDILEVSDKKNYIRVIGGTNNDWSLQKILLYAADENSNVAIEAVEALARRGESARLLIKKALQSEDRRAWRASIKYLSTRLNDSLWAEIPANAYEDTLSHFGQPVVWVPVGEFLMGSDKEQHSITLPGYWIGRYPVTVAQWKVFVKESGYKSNTQSLQDPEKHPVRYVNWDDTLAYCKWLSEKSGLPVTLPSEAEWEKAARGTDSRIYPWGGEFYKNKCNTSESGKRSTTPVGKYSPAGDSPYGCADMVGNVWEWTRSKLKNYPYNAEDGRENLEGIDHRVVRGGSWSSYPDYARVSYRRYYSPNLRNDDLGFRLVVRLSSL